MVALNGQHCDADTVLLAAHVVLVQSCTAPIVCPISWAITFHSVDVLAITLAPLTVDVSCVCASITHSCPSQAKPTDAPVSQVVRSVHSAFESERVPRQAEKRFSRSSIVTLLEQGTFHSAVDGAVPGQFASVITSVERPSVMLNVLSNKFELPASQSLTPPKTKPCRKMPAKIKKKKKKTYAELICEMILALANSVVENSAVYVQSVATPISATCRVVGHPSVLPIVVLRLTPAEFPDPP